MSETYDLERLLDDGWELRLFRNPMDSYSAEAKRVETKGDDGDEWTEKSFLLLTDDFTPEKALARIVRKVYRQDEYKSEPAIVGETRPQESG